MKGIIFNMSGKEIYIHDTVIHSWIIVILLSIFAIYVGNKAKKVKPKDRPKGILNIVEMVVEGIRSLVKSTMGEDKMKFAPYIMTLAFFLVVANLFGLLGLTPPTSDYNVTFALAIITFVLTQYYGLKSKGLKGYIKGFFEPVFFLFPLNIIGELANPVSLSFRLFGNILSGVIIMGLLYNALGFVAPVITPIFHSYFDIFSGLIQTFIFMMLTMVFVSMAMDD
ncbi:F0F1 ATP synthase subunit A [Clostridiaceae bacterium M8S5]|nr:F0F1 ATP synthase subunit A [Clostridiaceae bacterium M8S5]